LAGSNPSNRRTAHRAPSPGWTCIPGGDIDDAAGRSALLDRYCARVGRDPATIIRSIHLPVSYDQPGIAKDAIAKAIDAGFGHIVLGLQAGVIVTDPAYLVSRYFGNLGSFSLTYVPTPTADRNAARAQRSHPRPTSRGQVSADRRRRRAIPTLVSAGELSPGS
jgi:hypothetical protein